MVDRQFIAAWMVADTRRRWRRPSSHVLEAALGTGLILSPTRSLMRCGGRRPRLGLGHPHIDGNYRSTI
jgi:hypothetical protein